MPDRRHVCAALLYAAPLGAPIALLATLALGLASLVLDASHGDPSLRAAVPLVLRVLAPRDLLPLLVALSFAAGFALALSASTAGERSDAA